MEETCILVIQGYSINSSPSFICMCYYKDTSGLFNNKKTFEEVVPICMHLALVQYHREHKVYCVCLNHAEISNKYFRFNGEDKESTEENKGERFVYPTVDKFEVVLVSPETWEIVPETSIDLEEWEHVIALKNVSLTYEGTLSGLKEYICVGTNYTYSEDITSRGRVRR